MTTRMFGGWKPGGEESRNFIPREAGFPTLGTTDGIWDPEIAGYQQELSPSEQFQSFLGRVFPQSEGYGYSPMQRRAQQSMLAPSYSAYQLGRVAAPDQQFYEYLNRNLMPDATSMAANLGTAMRVSAPSQFQYVEGGTEAENLQRLANEVYLRSLGDPEAQMALAMAPMMQATAPAMRGGIQGAMDPLLQTFLGQQTTGPAIGGFLNFLRNRYGDQFSNLFGSINPGSLGGALSPTAGTEGQVRQMGIPSTRTRQELLAQLAALGEV